MENGEQSRESSSPSSSWSRVLKNLVEARFFPPRVNLHLLGGETLFLWAEAFLWICHEGESKSQSCRILSSAVIHSSGGVGGGSIFNFNQATLSGLVT